VETKIQLDLCFSNIQGWDCCEPPLILQDG
jgi:hypothetical protein